MLVGRERSVEEKIYNQGQGRLRFFFFFLLFWKKLRRRVEVDFMRERKKMNDDTWNWKLEGERSERIKIIIIL